MYTYDIHVHVLYVYNDEEILKTVPDNVKGKTFPIPEQMSLDYLIRKVK